MAIITASAGQTFDWSLLSPLQLPASYPPNTAFGFLQNSIGNQLSFSFISYIDNNAGLITNSGFDAGDTLLQRAQYNGTILGPVFSQSTTDTRQVALSGSWTISDGSGATVATVTGANVTLNLTTGVGPYLGNPLHHSYLLTGSVWDIFDDTGDVVRLGNGNDRYFDPAGSLDIDLGGGDDFLFAAGANDPSPTTFAPDRILGGSGNDTIEYQYFGHWIDGGSGNDVISGGGGSSNGVVTTFIGGSGDDYISGGQDTLFIEGADSGNDRYLTSFNATFDYSTAGALLVDFSDVVGLKIIEKATGDTDTLQLYGAKVIGSGLSDEFRSYSADEQSPYRFTYEGRGGDDFAELNLGGAVFDGGSGNDLAGFSLAAAATTISTSGSATMVTFTAPLGQVFQTTLTNVELLRFADRDVSLLPTTTVGLTSAADTWTAPGSASYVIDAKAGNDTIAAGGGNDTILGGAGNDILSGSAGHDLFRYVAGNSGTDAVDGGTGMDRILAEASGLVLRFSSLAGIEEILGNLSGTALAGTKAAENFDFSATKLTYIYLIDMGGGADSVIGSDGSDWIRGGSGNDQMAGGAGNDTFELAKGAGVDVIDGGTGFDTVQATSAAVTFYFASFSNVETIIGFGDTRLVGSAGADHMDLSLFSVLRIGVIDAGAGDDTVIGSSGWDTILGGAGLDILTGGDGADVFDFDRASDSRGSTADTITDWQDGFDRIDLSTIDADSRSAASGNQAFTFSAAGAFSRLAGELIVQVQAGDTHVLGDLNGDGKADFDIRLTGTAFSLDATDFLL